MTLMRVIISPFGVAGFLALLTAAPAAAQHSESPWSISATASLTGFRGAAIDRTDEGEFTVRPSQGIAVGAGVTRRLGAWTASLGISHLSTYVEALSDEVAVQERTMSLDRLRFAFTTGRRLARIGVSQLEARGSVLLDSWSVAGEDERSAVGGEMAMALQVPVGRVVVENVLGIGLTAGPFRASELPAGYERRALRAVTAGVGVRVGL